MTSINKNRTPWILTVSSMILLFSFVGYWNVSTYFKEKKKLVEDTEIQLQLAFTEVKDSELTLFIRTQLTNDQNNAFPDSLSGFLHNSYFPSFKNDTSEVKNRKSFPSQKEIDTTIILDFDLKSSQYPRLNKGIKGREITVIASSNINSISVNELEKSKTDSSQLEFKVNQINIRESSNLAKSKFHLITDSTSIPSWFFKNDTTALIFNNSEDHDSNPDSKTLRFFDGSLKETKTSVDKIYALFKEKLVANKLPFTFNIVSDPSAKEEGLRVTYEANGFGFTDWTIDLKEYQLFILKKMIPTILFSLFLLGTIGLAFWTLLANWIKQNRLVILKNEFINNMTHELKTPIATVGVALEAISNFNLEAEQDKAKEYIDISRTEMNRLSLLVDKVLNIAAFDSKAATLQSEAVNLKRTIEDIIQSMKLQLEEKNAHIDFNNSVSNPIIVGDKLHMSNVVHNIIDNALKYSSTESRIEISLSENQENLILKFTDNGQGIPKEYLDKIFDRFFRVPNEDQHDVKGHGLGLNYVRHIIQGHGGTISVESTENIGSVFTIKIPKSLSNV